MWWGAGRFAGETGAGFHIGIKEAAVLQEESFAITAACEIEAVLFAPGVIAGEGILCYLVPLIIGTVEPLIGVIDFAGKTTGIRIEVLKKRMVTS